MADNTSFWEQIFGGLPNIPEGPSPLMQLAALGGGQVLSGLGSLIGGPSEQEKYLQDKRGRAKKVYNLANNRLGQNVLDPQQYLAQYMRARVPAINAEAGRIQQQFGLDSGVAQGALFDRLEAPLAQFMLNAQMQNDQLKARNDNMLLQLMASL